MCMHTFFMHMPLQSLSLLAFVPFFPDHSASCFCRWANGWNASEVRNSSDGSNVDGWRRPLPVGHWCTSISDTEVGWGKCPQWIEATQIDRGYVAVRAGTPCALLVLHVSCSSCFLFLFLLLLLLLFACLLACLLACLPVCLFACLLICLLDCHLFVCNMFVCLSVCLFVCLSVCLSVCLFVCLFVCLLDCFLSCLHKRF